ncbi:outer membrane lipoprotein chaperone LolA [Thauera linaloolentis]|uniref:Outer-membrane lipoprotein carrier protein n=1 Tax=Thauera linaloolentis (strain DSM 12138 / JCM 21573 / CCUG 41526 / CIP 105981 / IAM 15112 / NBRC 102519 / 47Lol) TaxID=1123367 RepID=N6Y747_THAL4|nr:outer membrane lipoprotein chaperone LolA [Thauera linaloolentis]ENO90091.1 outer membrane lipoprotein carrier protein LolA [Thauera linaloolentis 47Lol = DSM 12138]MCM8565375.1 outer membrane lipoprotein chaperone LolA [Thauera linaloolentis]
MASVFGPRTAAVSFAAKSAGCFARASLALALAATGGIALAADGVAQLRQFVSATRSAEGDFEQTVVAQSGRKPQQASGSFAYARPGRFHWEYDRPYRQVLVGDGSRLWTWDPDLNQVTVRSIGDALGATPAAILFGSGALEDGFTLAEGGSDGGLIWVEARPRQTDSGFESLRIGLQDGQLHSMEMRDNFGQTTLIRFTRLQPNPQLAADRFRFTPPAGADVIGDVSGSDAAPGR